MNCSKCLGAAICTILQECAAPPIDSERFSRSFLRQEVAMGHEYITVMNYTYTCQNTTMAQLAERLPSAASKDLDHPVVDLTGLKGAYDFVLSWSVPPHVDSLPDIAPPDWRAGQAAPGPRPSQSGGLTVFEGVGKLGLKLAAQKQSAPVLVIDHVDRIPAH